MFHSAFRKALKPLVIAPVRWCGAYMLVGLVLDATIALAQQQRPVRWRASAARAVEGGLATRLSTAIPEGWYVYALDEPAGGPVPLRVSVLNEGARVRGTIESPEPDRKADRNFNMISLVYTESTTLRLVADHVPDGQPLRMAVRFQACTDRYCLPARTDTVEATRVTSAPSTAAGAETSTIPRGPLRAPRPPVAVPEDPTPPLSGTALGVDLVAFVWLAMSTGLLALLTPCVLPMVPITVGFFTARRDARRAFALRDAGLFALGIVTSFVTLGLGVTLLVGASGIVSLAANPWMNLLVAGLFLGFAAQLAGWWTVALPSALLGRLAAATAGKRSVPALLAMGATFSLTSFTCTAPFVGTLLVIAARGSWAWPLLGLAAYATVFALPFFVLALFPAAVSLLPRSGPWLATLKGVIAFLEVAAVIKFASNAAMVWGWPFATREHVLTAWAIIAAALVLWLARDTYRSWARESWPLAATRLLVIAASVWALVVCVQGVAGTPVGELEAFLPPRPAGLASDGLAWRLNDFEGARAAAREGRGLVFVDFTGYTCTNCRWMEANMFTRPAVRRALERFERARLYTDGEGAIFTAQQALQERMTGSVALPYYVVLDADGTVQRAFLGMTRDEREFLSFLQDTVITGPSGQRRGLVP